MKKTKHILLALFMLAFSFQILKAQCELTVTDFVVEAYPCDSDGNFMVDLDFNYTNATISDSFLLQVNGIHYGTFAYIDLYITVGPFAGDGITDYEFFIMDQVNFCFAVKTLNPVNCNNPNCNISDITVDNFICNPNGTYDLTLDFNYQNVNNDFFDVIVDGVNFGFYAFNDLPVLIENFPASGNTFDYIQVCQNDLSTCCEGLEFEAPNCSSTCQITELIAEATPCDADGNFSVGIDFDYQNTSDSFSIVGNGNNYGTFAYVDLFITLGPFEGNGSELEFIIIDQNDPNCTNWVGLTSPNCANQVDCIDFNNLTTGATYGNPQYQPDDLIFMQQGVPVKIQEYKDGNTTSFNSVITLDNSLPIYNYPNMDGTILYPYICNMEFNMLQLNDAVIHVEFDFWNEGNGINISTNDAPLLEANSLFDLDGATIAPGVTLTIIPDPNDSTLGKAVIDGFVGLLTIGGNDGLIIDNLCLEYANLGDCWAGDTDLDNLTSNFDLLNIGLAYGKTGTPRQDANIAWLGQPSADWTDSFGNGVNYKHADTNGDGIINAADKEAITQNFGLTHGNVDPYIAPVPATDAPSLFVQMPDPSNISVGAFEAEIHLGTTTNTLDDVYGLAFTLDFNDQIFDASSLEIIFENGWLNNNGGDDLLSFQKMENGKVYASVTRINQDNISGGGKIGKLVGIIDDLSGYALIDFTISNVKLIRTNEEIIPINTPENSVEVNTNSAKHPYEQNIQVFPNPASDFIFIKNQNEAPIERVRLVNILGQELLEQNNSNKENFELDIHALPEGIYILEMQMDKVKIAKKIKIEHP